VTDVWSWDIGKAESNHRKHRVRFEMAVLVFDDPLLLTQPDPHPDGDRWRSIGAPRPDLSLLLFVVHTGDPETGGRIISARRATPVERRAYEAKH